MVLDGLHGANRQGNWDRLQMRSLNTFLSTYAYIHRRFWVCSDFFLSRPEKPTITYDVQLMLTEEGWQVSFRLLFLKHF